MVLTPVTRHTRPSTLKRLLASRASFEAPGPLMVVSRVYAERQ